MSVGKMLVCDYDGTIAREGSVAKTTIDFLKKFKAAGGLLCLDTGRILSNLQNVFPEVSEFDWVVVENGAELYQPATGDVVQLADGPPEKFLAKLNERNIPYVRGASIVSTWEPHEKAALECIQDLGLEFQLIFNKGAVMILPTGVNKATGLQAVLERLNDPKIETIGVGDAENDHALLRACTYAVAVANALPSLKEEATYVTKGEDGDGVAELIQLILSDQFPPQEHA